MEAGFAFSTFHAWTGLTLAGRLRYISEPRSGPGYAIGEDYLKPSGRVPRSDRQR